MHGILRRADPRTRGLLCCSPSAQELAAPSDWRWVTDAPARLTTGQARIPIARSADPNLTDFAGRARVHVARAKGHDELVEILRQASVSE
jgi:hypothetical protein